jgi:Ca-activated chloride channel family protein
MELFAASSGLSGLVTDVREFLVAVRVARPSALWLLLLLPLLGLLNRWANRRRARAVALIGRPGAVAGQLTHPRPAPKWIGLAYPLAWVLLVLGVAGPRWGKSDEPGVAVGRDLVIVIDLSRTMLADDMSDPKVRTRWEAARAGALDLLQAVARRGGHRVAVIVFAAKPKLLCPLTTDYEHARAVLEDLDGEYPPPEIRMAADPEAASGTRIGLALIAAVQAHDRDFIGSQDILLISDGDDPGGDAEWVRGASAARAAKIPVHTVGVGDPKQVTTVVIGGEPLFGTSLHEDLLRQIADETRITEEIRGHYVPARRDVPKLGEFFRTRIEPNPSREYTGDQVPQPKERYAWFLAPALALFLIGWVRGK